MRHKELNFQLSASQLYSCTELLSQIIFVHCKGMQREGIPPFQSQQKGGPVQPTECLNAQTVNGHRFCQLPTTRKQTPHFLPLCVCAPTAKCG